MKHRDVIFAPEAHSDLFALYEWISTKADPDTALNYIEKLEVFCNGFDLASQRGTVRHDIRPGLRIVGFRKRLTIAFITSDTSVTILRIFYGGQNWETHFDSE